jgi:hypothetical protein
MEEGFCGRDIHAELAGAKRRETLSKEHCVKIRKHRNLVVTRSKCIRGI